MADENPVPDDAESAVTDAPGEGLPDIAELEEGDAAIEKIAQEMGGEDWAKSENIAERIKGEHAGEDELRKDQEVSGEDQKKDEVMGEGAGEEVAGEQGAIPETKEDEDVFEEAAYEEEPPPDPAAPYDFSDSKEALKAPFELRPDQVAECESLWQLYQDYTPAYADLDGYVTPVELVYLLKCLLLMTHTAEQMQELIDYCVRPPHRDNHVNFEQFLKMVTLRQRDMPIEEELRMSLEVLDPDNTGQVDREYLREVLTSHGYGMNPKAADTFIKEVDMTNEGTIGIEDVVGTLCIDLNRDDIVMLQNTLNPPALQDDNIDDLI